MTAPGSKIIAMGHYQPARVLTNADLAEMVDTSDEWIRDRVGILTQGALAALGSPRELLASSGEESLSELFLRVTGEARR